jgi:hypothetical protein
MYNHFQYLSKALGVRDRNAKRNVPATRKAHADAGLSVNHLFDLYPVFKLKGVALVPFHSRLILTISLQLLERKDYWKKDIKHSHLRRQ